MVGRENIQMRKYLISVYCALFLSSHHPLFLETSLCDQNPPPCDTETTACNAKDGSAVCTCMTGYVPSPYQIKSCSGEFLLLRKKNHMSYHLSLCLHIIIIGDLWVRRGFVHGNRHINPDLVTSMFIMHSTLFFCLFYNLSMIPIDSVCFRLFFSQLAQVAPKHMKINVCRK